MQANFSQRVEHVGDVIELGPVVLDVLAGREMAIALVPAVSQFGQLVHLGAVERAIGNGHPQHVSMQLQIKPVHQAQGLELILGQIARNPARDLGSELAVAFG